MIYLVEISMLSGAPALLKISHQKLINAWDSIYIIARLVIVKQILAEVQCFPRKSVSVIQTFLTH